MSPATARRIDLAFVVTAAALIVAGAVTAAAVVGSPAARASDAWEEFTSGYPDEFEGSHFTEFGDYRADVWRIAFRQFRDAPLLGAGTDNFGPAHIAERRFDNETRFPHSIQLAILGSTGIVGGLLFVALVGSAFAAYLRARARDALTAAVGAAALLVFTYWLVHGSVDWFWEIPALGGPAFAFLGAAAGLRQPPDREAAASARRASARSSQALIGLVAIAALAAVCSATPPWLATRQTHVATPGWRGDPSRAIEELELAARLNPLSVRPLLLAGTIANRTGHPKEARALLLRALERSNVNWYAKLELAVAEATLDDRGAALTLLREAAALNPREPAIGLVREWVLAGEVIDLDEVDRIFLNRVSSRTGRAVPTDPG